MVDQEKWGSYTESSPVLIMPTHLLSEGEVENICGDTHVPEVLRSYGGSTGLTMCGFGFKDIHDGRGALDGLEQG